MLEIACHAPDRDTFWTALADHNVVEIDAETGEPRAAIVNPDTGLNEIDWVELGDLVKTPAVLDENGDVVTPAVMYGLHFVNMRGWGSFEAGMTAGLDQTDEEGNLKWLFDRTHLSSAFPTLINYELDPLGGTPRGYAGSSGVHFYDPADLNNRANVWA